jgi:hypothetical protein
MKLAEASVPEITMLDIMEHVSTATLRRYSHIRAQARWGAVEARQNSMAKASLQKSAATH